MKSKKSFARFLISVMFFSLMTCAFSFAWQRESGFKDRGNLSMGSDKIQGSSSTGLYFDTNGDNVTDITFSTNNVISGAVISSSSGTYTNLNTTYLTVTSSATLTGNVGIASASPAQKLDVVGSGKFSTSVITPQVNAADSNGLKLYDDATNGIFVKDGGNVGIGTTNPIANAHFSSTNVVVGQDSVQTTGSNLIVVGQAASYHGGSALGNAYVFVVNHAVAAGSPAKRMLTYSRNNANSSYFNDGFFDVTKNAGENTSYMRFGVSNGSDAIERVRIIKDGNVGIATSAPAYKLDVAGDIKSSSSVYVTAGIISSTQTITVLATQTLWSTNTIRAGGSYVLVASSGGVVSMGSNPQINTSGIPTGTYIEIEGTSDTNTITLVTGNGLLLTGGVSFTLGLGDVIALRYTGTVWRECFRANN